MKRMENDAPYHLSEQRVNVQDMPFARRPQSLTRAGTNPRFQLGCARLQRVKVEVFLKAP